MLIPTYYLLSKIWDIFATRRRILLKINKNYFRGGQMRRISKDITKHYQMRVCHSNRRTLIFVLSVNRLQGNVHNTSLQLYRQIPIRMGRPTPYIVSNVA